MPNLPIVCGHRGHCAAAPENTLAAFRAAHREGARACEIDAVLSADGEIMVLHDLTVDRTTNGTGAAFQMSAALIGSLDAGSWFSPAYAGEPVPTLAMALRLAAELDLHYEIEIKEVRRLGAFLDRLAGLLTQYDALERVHVISFDHVDLATAKARIPGLKTGGILHERLADPVGAARAAGLDRLCIDLDRLDLGQAEAIRAAGISIRCHTFTPDALAQVEREGLPYRERLETAVRQGLVDVVSSDDVAWARHFVATVR